MSVASRIESIEQHLIDAYDEIEAKGVILNLLPTGYTQVEYLRSSGTQYIDTGVIADNNLRVVIDMQASATSGNPIGSIYRNGSTYIRYHFSVTATYYRWYIDTTNNQIRTDGLRHIWDIQPTNGKIYRDEVQINSFTPTTFDTDVTFRLFGRNSNESSLQTKDTITVYSCKMYSDNTLIRDFIPCYRNSDNEIGLYDLVTDTFYTNSGTGTFTHGSKIGFEKNISNLASAISLIPTN